MSENVPLQNQGSSDATLVIQSLGGNRDAYRYIIERYQRLVCSLAYSSMGSVAESEDVAQETFIEGWTKLATLREPEKLRSWLCGILRYKISHRIRKESKEPSTRASTLSDLEVSESNEQPVEEETMRNEEHELLWNALKEIPENYREPLVLFYREHKSIKHVANELELSEDTVKQRLSRGRKMLQERMLTFVEDALVSSSPGRVFTISVLAALPALAPTAKAVGVGATVAQVSSMTKTVGLAAALASVSGLISSFFMLRANLDQSRTATERKHVIRTTAIFLGGSIGFILMLAIFLLAAIKWPHFAGYLTVLSQLTIFTFLIGFPIATLRMLKRNGQLRTQERLKHPEAFNNPIDQIGSKSREYKSKHKLLGIPLIHIQFASKEENEGPAVGWIAFGEKAYGVLFAFGGYAVGGVSVGIISFGLITCSAIGVGLIGMGTIGVGLLGLGAIAIGYKAFASLSALGWESAWSPGFSIAREAAIGRIAYAKEINSDFAAQIASLQQLEQYHVFVLWAMSALVIIPVIAYAQGIRKRMRK